MRCLLLAALLLPAIPALAQTDLTDPQMLERVGPIYQTLKKRTDPPVPPALIESADGTTIPPAGQIVDAELVTWTLVAGKVLRDGVEAGLTSNVVTVSYRAKVVYQTNADGLEWKWENNVWTAVVVTPPPPPPEPTCLELTSQGSVIARVTAPTGAGSKNMEVIRDGFPASSSSTEYDTYDGENTAPDDWIGYAYPVQQTFGKVVFQEGVHYSRGGWFDTLTVQVRQAGAWVPVSGLVITPAYPGVKGAGFQTYTLSFDSIQGDGIRLFGKPGGTADFISVGELLIYTP